MLKAEDFKLPLDREFTLVKIKQEIDECDDKQALRDNLKALVQQNAQYQHLISKMLEAELHRSLSDFADFIEEKTNGNTTGN